MADVPIYGLMAEFSTPEALVEAARRCYAEGYRKMDGYSPVSRRRSRAKRIGFHKNRLPLIVLIGGILGCARRVLFAVLGCRHRLPDQRRRPAFE